MQMFHHPVLGPTSVLEVKRQTGRTLRMLAEALASAKNGFRTFVMLTPVEAHQFADNPLFANEPNLKIENYITVHQYNWDTMMMGGEYMAWKIFIDHAVFERQFRRQLALWHQYDTFEPIIIDKLVVGVSYNEHLLPPSQIKVGGIPVVKHDENLVVKSEYPKTGEPFFTPRSPVDRRQSGIREEPKLPPELPVATDLTPDVASPGLGVVHE